MRVCGILCSRRLSLRRIMDMAGLTAGLRPASSISTQHGALEAGGVGSSSAWADCGSAAVQYQRKRPDIRLAFHAFITHASTSVVMGS
jgi:hypothetical protein